MAFLTAQLETLPENYQEKLIQDFEMATGIAVSLEPKTAFDAVRTSNVYAEFQEQLRLNLTRPFTVRRISGDAVIEVHIGFPHYTPQAACQRETPGEPHHHYLSGMDDRCIAGIPCYRSAFSA